MKRYHVCGLGNAIVDILTEVSEAEFAPLKFEKGSMRLVELPEQRALLNQFVNKEPVLVSGGSVANSIIVLSQLGGKGAFIGALGDDRYGHHYVSECEALSIDIGNPIHLGEHTGTCLVLITPDAERTMRVSLGITAHLSERHVEVERIAASEWLFIEGYVFANPEKFGLSAIRAAVKVAKAHGTKIAVTCSEAFVVQSFGKHFKEVLDVADLVFANASEACALTEEEDVREAFAVLTRRFPGVVVTAGHEGAFTSIGSDCFHTPAVAVNPKDLTGAGDAFAGAFLYGLTHGVPVRKCAQGACALAAKVICQIGARLTSGARECWDQSQIDPKPEPTQPSRRSRGQSEGEDSTEKSKSPATKKRATLQQ